MNREITSKDLGLRQKRIYEFLERNKAGVLATVDPNGEPHATVIYHTVDKDFEIFFLTKSGTKKYDNLIRKNDVMLVVFEASSQTVVQISGKAYEIKAGIAINAVAASIFAASLESSQSSIPPITKLHSGDYVAFRITPKQIRMNSFLRPVAGSPDELFDSIESFEFEKPHP